MPSLNDVLLRRLIRNPLVDIGFRVSDDREAQWDLKSMLLSGLISVETISTSGRCKLSLGEEPYYDALESSFFSGVIRCVRQDELCQKLKSEKIPPAAWNIVTLYYACFFCVTELLRVYGVWNIFLTASDAKKANEINIVGTDFSSGTYTVIINNDGSSFQAFMSKAEGTGGGFHQTVWDRFNSVISIKQSQLTSIDDRNRYRALLDGLNSRKSPSVIRNKWNYRDPHLFSSYGDSIASGSLHANSCDERGWLRSFKGINSESDEIFSLLNIHHLSSNLIRDSLRYILPERKLQRINRLYSGR